MESIPKYLRLDPNGGRYPFHGNASNTLKVEPAKYFQWTAFIRVGARTWSFRLYRQYHVATWTDKLHFLCVDNSLPWVLSGDWAASLETAGEFWSFTRKTEIFTCLYGRWGETTCVDPSVQHQDCTVVRTCQHKRSKDPGDCPFWPRWIQDDL